MSRWSAHRGPGRAARTPTRPSGRPAAPCPRTSARAPGAAGPRWAGRGSATAPTARNGPPAQRTAQGQRVRPLPLATSLHPAHDRGMPTMPEFAYTDLLPLGPDTTRYRLLTAAGVAGGSGFGRDFLGCNPEVMTLLAREGISNTAY